MPNFRRAYVPGGTFFLTSVTRERRPILTEPLHRSALADALRTTQWRRPFACEAIVLLPDHWHIIMTLPAGDADFAGRMHRIKRRAILLTGDRSLWQRGYWERTVRDESELAGLVEYVHYNPVKHRVASCPHAWPFSSFHRYVRAGAVAQDWACSCDGDSRDRPYDDLLSPLVGE